MLNGQTKVVNLKEQAIAAVVHDRIAANELALMHANDRRVRACRSLALRLSQAFGVEVPSSEIIIMDYGPDRTAYVHTDIDGMRFLVLFGGIYYGNYATSALRVQLPCQSCGDFAPKEGETVGSFLDLGRIVSCSRRLCQACSGATVGSYEEYVTRPEDLDERVS